MEAASSIPITMFFILRLGLTTILILLLTIKDTTSLPKVKDYQLNYCGYATVCHHNSSQNETQRQRRCDSFPGGPTGKLFWKCETKLPNKAGYPCQITINAPNKGYFGSIRSDGHQARRGGHQSHYWHQCLYKIQTQPRHKIRLFFNYFDLPPRKGKCGDFVQIFEAQFKWSAHQTVMCYNKTNATCFQCGKELDRMSPISFHNWIYIFPNFKLNGERKYRGFQVDWDIIDVNSTGTLIPPPIWLPMTTLEGLYHINNTRILYPVIVDENHKHAFSFTVGPIVGGCVVIGLLIVFVLGIHTCIKHKKRRQQHHDGVVIFTPAQFQMQDLPTPPAYFEHYTEAPPPYDYPGNEDENEVAPLNIGHEISDAPPPYSDEEDT